MKRLVQVWFCTILVSMLSITTLRAIANPCAQAAATAESFADTITASEAGTSAGFGNFFIEQKSNLNFVAKYVQVGYEKFRGVYRHLSSKPAEDTIGDVRVVKYGGTDALLVQHNYGTSVQCFMLIYVKQALQFDASQITPQQAAALREGKNIQVSSPQ